MRRMHLGSLMVAILPIILAATVAETIFQVAVVDAPRPAIFWLIGSHSTFILLILVLLLLLINSNTRRPEGIDPNFVNQRDPFAEPTERLKVMVGNKPYGAREGDDKEVVKRLIGKFEAPAIEPPSANKPSWIASFAADAPEDVKRALDLDLEPAESDTDRGAQHANTPQP